MNCAMQALLRHLSSLHARCSAFAADRGGVAAIEFAMLLPLLVTLYLGVVEVSQAVSVDRKLGLAARIASDLVAQSKNITDDEMKNIFKATEMVTRPYSPTPLKLKISAVTIDANKNAVVAWGDADKTTARVPGSSVDKTDLPDGLRVANTTIILSEASYDYKPTIGYVITGTMTLTDHSYMRPRLQNTVTRSAT